jgi:transketolase
MDKDVRQQFADTMLTLGQEDPRLVVLVSDISHFKLQPFAKACPGRFYNIGICEPSIVSLAAGLSRVGFHPVAHTITPFLIERAFEQIKLDFCYQQLGGNLISVGGAFDYAALGCTHHCYDDFSLLRPLPGAQLFYPGSAVEFDQLFRKVYANGKLNYFRIPAKTHGQEFLPKDIRPGKGIRLVSGKDITIVACGPQLQNALLAQERLKKDRITADVIYIHTIFPLDMALVKKSLLKTKRLLVVEEHYLHGGLGQTILSAIKDMAGLRSAFLAIPDKTFVTGYGSYEDHCARLGFTPQGIVSRVKKLLAQKRRST